MADIGTILKGNRGEYELTALLGDGLTARVFKAKTSYLEAPVAVKVLKPGLPAEIVARFQTEFTNVNAVNGKIEAAAKASGFPDNGADSPASPPAFHEFVSQQGDQPAFLVLELMTGQMMERWLIERGPLPEMVGLRAGVQLFGLFHILHQEVGNTYADFKFENLWWEQDRERLRVTDWNVLGDPLKLTDNIPTDLARAARALVRILTGVPVSRGQRLDLHPGWDTLSDGTQRLLIRLLDVDKDRRPRSADEVRQELRRLVGYWQIAPERGLRMAEAALAGAGSRLDDEQLDPETRRTVEETTLQTLDLLSILHAREVNAAGDEKDRWPAEHVHQLDELHAQAKQFAPSADKMLERALSLLWGGSGDKALEQLQRAISVFPDDLRAFRWREYAEAVVAGRAGPEGVQKQWREAIETCQGGDFANAAKGVRALEDEGLALALRHEITVHTSFDGISSAADPVSALQLASRANEALQDLRDMNPGYALAVERNLGIPIAEVVELHREHVAAANRDAEVAKEIALYGEISRSSTRFPEGATRVEERLRLFTDQEGVLLAALALGEKCLDHGKFDSARQIFSAGAVLDHSHTRDFLLRWQVANAAALRKAEGNTPLGETTAREVETARKSIEAAMLNLEPELPEYKKLNGLLGIIDPKGPKLATRQFDAALDVALKEDPDKTVVAVGNKLKPHQLASALLLALNRDKLDPASRKTLIEIIEKHLQLSQSVLMLLTGQRSPVKDALAQAADKDTAAVAIAQAVELPQKVSLLAKLMGTLPPTVDKTKLANELRDLAYRFGAEQDPLPVPVPVPVPQPHPLPVPTPVPVPQPDPKPEPKLEIDDLLDALNSKDPQRWEQVTSIPTAQRSGWPQELVTLASQRNKDLLLHRREMETVLQGFATDPIPVKERMMRWRSTNHLTTAWDSRNQRWAPADELWQEIEQAADTAQARKWLDIAGQWMRNPKLGDVKNAIILGLALTKADPAVLTELQDLLDKIQPVRHPATADVPTAPATGALHLPQAAPQSHQPGSLGALLEAPLRESETLTHLYIRLGTLAQDDTKYKRHFSKLTLDLQVWTEEERWLINAEEQQKNGRAQEQSKGHAQTAIRNLDSLLRTEAWRPYATIETPPFANMRKRLQAIAGPTGKQNL